MLVEDPELIQGVSLVVSIIPFEDILIPIKLEMVMISAEDENTEIAFKQEIDQINIPIVLEIPEVEQPTFAVEVPIDEDAIIMAEFENLLTYRVASLPTEILESYKLFFVENGWIENDSYQLERQDIEFTAVEYIKNSQYLTLIVGEEFGISVVSLSIEESERFLGMPLLHDADIQDEIPDEAIIYRTMFSHDEALEFYTNALEDEGWTLENWGKEIFDDFEVTVYYNDPQ